MTTEDETAARGLPIQLTVAIAVGIAVVFWLFVLSRWGPFSSHGNSQQINQILDQIAGEV
jgi:hypothetical protein